MNEAIGQIKFLNAFGDITIEWDEKDRAKMLKIIKEKLDEGFQFYIVKKRFFGLFGEKKEKLKKITKLSNNKVLIKDKDISDYFEGITSARIIDDNTDKHEVVSNSRNPEEIVKSTSVCTKPPTRG